MDESHDAVQGPQFRHAGSVRGFPEGIRTIEENSDAIVLESTAGNDGREQYQLKAPAETELSGSGGIDENAFDILAAERYPEGQEKLIEFVVLTANANGASVDDLKSRAVGNWNLKFIKAFETWVSKQASAKKEPANEKEIPAAHRKQRRRFRLRIRQAGRQTWLATKSPRVMPQYGMISGPGT